MVKEILIFVGGAGSGAVASFFVSRKKFEKVLAEEITKIDNNYKELVQSLKAELDAKKSQIDVVKTVVEEDKTNIPPVVEIVKETRANYNGYSSLTKPYNSFDEGLKSIESESDDDTEDD